VTIWYFIFLGDVILPMIASGSRSAPYTEYQPSVSRIVGICFVVLLHIALVYLLLTALSRRPLEFVPPPIETKILQDVKQEKTEPPPPPPKFQPPPPPFVPPPDIQIQTPAPVAKTAIQNVTNKPVPPPPPAADVRVPPRLDPKHPIAPTESDYPPMAVRMEMEGVTFLEVFVDADGNVTDAKVVKSSGYDVLDTAAIALAKRRGHFIPGTVNGKPTPETVTVPIRWQLNN
jgi:protein TonB